MVDPITVGAFMAAGSAIKACKKALETADDIGAIGKHLDAIFKTSGEAEKQQTAAEKKLSHNQKAVTQRIGEDSADEAGAELSEIASRRVAELEHQEALKSLGKQLDQRFGRGTWDGIIEEQKKQAAIIKKKKQQAKEKKERAAEESKEFWHKVLIETGKVAILIVALGVLTGWLWWAFQQSPK